MFILYCTNIRHISFFLSFLGFFAARAPLARSTGGLARSTGGADCVRFCEDPLVLGTGRIGSPAGAGSLTQTTPEPPFSPLCHPDHLRYTSYLSWHCALTRCDILSTFCNSVRCAQASFSVSCKFSHDFLFLRSPFDFSLVG